MQTIKFYIPFEGYYNSIYDSIIDSTIDDEINEGYLKNDDNINYQIIFNEMSVKIFDDIIEFINDEYFYYTDDDDINLNELIKYEGLSSPKYYNYSTDKLKASCNKNTYNILLNKFINDNDFLNYVNEASKSRDGFASFYEGINEVKKEPSIFLEYLFQYLVLNLHRDEIIDKTTENIHETIYNNI